MVSYHTWKIEQNRVCFRCRSMECSNCFHCQLLLYWAACLALLFIYTVQISFSVKSLGKINFSFLAVVYSLNLPQSVCVCVFFDFNFVNFVTAIRFEPFKKALLLLFQLIFKHLLGKQYTRMSDLWKQKKKNLMWSLLPKQATFHVKWRRIKHRSVMKSITSNLLSSQFFSTTHTNTHTHTAPLIHSKCICIRNVRADVYVYYYE